ncbi:thioredoxin-dependent peroxidase [Suillus lakei]|nr:thioredoxin-dependent peroxidase [Suillus lakei]
MTSLKISVGDTIPKGTFGTVPYAEELADHPTCHINHLPPYLTKYGEFKAKGVDVIAVVAANDPFVMSGWGRVEGLTDKIITLSDPNAVWSGSLGLSVDLSERGFGVRTARYAMIIDDLVIKYVEAEPGPGVTVSGADAVLAKL